MYRMILLLVVISQLWGAQANCFQVYIADADPFRPNIRAWFSDRIALKSTVIPYSSLDILPQANYSVESGDTTWTLGFIYVGENWIFMNAASVLIDGVRFDLTAADNPSTNVVGGTVSESMICFVDESFFQAMTNARDVKFRVTGNRYPIDAPLKKQRIGYMKLFYETVLAQIEKVRLQTPVKIDGARTPYVVASPAIIDSGETSSDTSEVIPNNVIAEWHGKGLKTTEMFEVVTQSWLVRWSFTPDDVVGPGSLQVYLHDSEGNLVDVLVNATAEGKDISYVHKGGRYYLKISGIGSWSVSVESVN